jgi:hypothetical protein
MFILRLYSTGINPNNRSATIGSVFVLMKLTLGYLINTEHSVTYTALQMKNKITALKKQYRIIKDQMDDTGILKLK